MIYFTFCFILTSNSSVYLTLKAHLNSNQPHFKCSTAKLSSGCHIGQHRSRFKKSVEKIMWIKFNSSAEAEKFQSN